MADINGGDSFSDIYGLSRFLYGCVPNLLYIVLGRRPILLPQTYGPYRSIFARRVAAFILRKATRVYARDYESFSVVDELSGNAVRPVFCPDVAVTLDARPPRNSLARKLEYADESSMTIGFNINGLMFKGGYSGRNMFGLSLDYRRFVVDLIDRILSVRPESILLIPHVHAPRGDPNSDIDACEFVHQHLAKRWGNRLSINRDDYDEGEAKAIIGKSRLFIGSRMHSCIGAFSQGIPTIAIAYSSKFSGVFESFGLGQLVIDARVHSAPNAIEKCLSLMNEYIDKSGFFMAAADSAKTKVQAVFSDLIAGYASG